MCFKLFLYFTGPLKLVREVFEQVKPGLSSFADDPKKVGLVEVVIICTLERLLLRCTGSKTDTLDLRKEFG